MTAFRYTAHLMLGLLVLFTMSACTREVTYVEETAAGPSSCFECHSDNDTYLVSASEQWSYSRHGSGQIIERNSASCSGCHTGDGFLDVAAGEDPQSYPNPGPIHCFTCHAPHSNGNFALRLDSPVELQNGVSRDIGSGNICVNCHQARRNVDTYVAAGDNSLSPYWGPHHGPQSDLLFGSNGYEYDGYEYSDSAGHRNALHPDDGQADGCVNCHLKSTRNFVVGGHSFNMRGEMVSEEGAEEVLNINACWACHDEPEEDIEGFDYEGVQTEIHGLLEDLSALLQAAGVVDATGHPISGTTTQGIAGALWNFLLIEEDRSFGVHNPGYAVDLLEASIAYMESLP